MARKNLFTTTPPFAVERSLKQLGENLRVARLRRNLTMEDVAEKIGTGHRAVIETEKHKPSKSTAVYAALLRAYDLLGQMVDLASQELDKHGIMLFRGLERERARKRKDLENDF